MKKLLPTLILSLMLTLPSVGLAATTPVIPPCPAEVLKYYPLGTIVKLIGPLVLNTGSINKNSTGFFGQCSFGANTKTGVGITGIVDVTGSKLGVDGIFDNYHKNLPNASLVMPGNQCDRYFTVDNGKGGIFIDAQKGGNFFSLIPTTTTSISKNDLLDTVEYACSQVSISTSTSPTPQPTLAGESTNLPPNTGGPGDGNPSDYFSWTNFLSSPASYPYILIALMALVAAVIIFVVWLFIHHKRISAMAPSIPPVIPPQTPPSVSPTNPQEPPSAPPVS